MVVDPMVVVVFLGTSGRTGGGTSGDIHITKETGGGGGSGFYGGGGGGGQNTVTTALEAVVVADRVPIQLVVV